MGQPCPRCDTASRLHLYRPQICPLGTTNLAKFKKGSCHGRKTAGEVGERAFPPRPPNHLPPEPRCQPARAPATTESASTCSREASPMLSSLMLPLGTVTAVARADRVD